MIRWMFFSTLATVVFFGLYCLAFRRDRWLQLSRAYLMVTLLFSLVYPLVRLPEVALPATLPEMEIGIGAATAVAAATVEPEAVAERPATALPAVLYLAGVVISLSVLLGQLVVQVVRLRRRPRIALLDDNTPPYSFFNHIVVGTRGLTEEELQCVLAHEEVHVGQRHTLDVLLMRLMCSAAWFNPLAWLMLRELRRVHEYLADEAVLAAHGREGYLGLLWRQATGTGYGHITNNFQSINIKNRIVMMNKQKSRFGAWKMLAVLPVAALLMMVGCKPAEAQKADGSAMQNERVAVSDTIYDVAEVMPEFPGGVEAMYKYLAQNIKYPEQAKKDGVQGRVFVQFVIEKDGSVSNAKVLRGIGGGCDEEALRVVNAMPKWKPGMQSGKPVRTQYNLPITFKLDK